MDKEKKGISKKVIVWIAVISVLLCAVIVFLFITFFKTREENIKEKDSGAVLMTYKNEDNTLSILKVTPIKDEDGIKMENKNEYFDFNITTKLEDATSIEYEIALTPNITDRTVLGGIKVYLERQSNGTYTKLFEPKVFAADVNESSFGSPKGSMIIAKVVKDSDSVDNYRLRIWIDEKATITEEVAKKISFDVSVHGKANSN